MALDKVTYVDDVTVIHADNLNDIQDEIIRNASDISGKVSKAGDTMSGNLEIENTSPGEVLKNTAMDVTDSSYTQNNSTGFRLRDKNDKNVAIATDRYLTNGTTGLWMSGWKTVNGTAISNTLGLYVDKDGNRVVDLYPSAWRAALNVVDKSGDTMTGNLLVKDSRITSGATPASDVYGNGFYTTDKDEAIVGYLREIALASGQQGVIVGARRLVNGANVENILRMVVNSSGGRVVYVNDPAPWRSALGLGEIVYGTNTSGNVSIPSGTATEFSSLTLTAGVWLVVACGDWAANGTGYRQIATSDITNPNRSTATTTVGISASGKETYQQLTLIRQITGASSTISFYGLQDSGSSLRIYPYVYATRIG